MRNILNKDKKSSIYWIFDTKTDKFKMETYEQINKENRHNKRKICEWADRKEFNKATKEKNCFGKTTEGIKPELMTDDEYMEFISQFESRPLVL